jgi:hypothetical protein
VIHTDAATALAILLRLFADVTDVKNILVLTKMNHLICAAYV